MIFKPEMTEGNPISLYSLDSDNGLAFTRFFYFQIFMSDKIDMVISVALPPVALLSAPMLVAKKYVLSAVSI